MGANGARLSPQEIQVQTEVLMQQNVDIAKRLTHQHNKKPGAMVNEVGKNMFADMKFKNNNAVAPGQMNQVKIEGATYDIIEFISKGGFGEVYKAQIRNKNRTVAIKVMINTPMIREEIQNEIRFLSLTRKIPLDDHPVINYYGCKFTKEKIHIAMELASCDLVKLLVHSRWQRQRSGK